VGVRIKVWPMERAALIAALKEKKLTGLTSGGTGILGNAATRLEPFVLSWENLPGLATPTSMSCTSSSLQS